jgi:hypothetical protein
MTDSEAPIHMFGAISAIGDMPMGKILTLDPEEIVAGQLDLQIQVLTSGVNDCKRLRLELQKSHKRRRELESAKDLEVEEAKRSSAVSIAHQKEADARVVAMKIECDTLKAECAILKKAKELSDEKLAGRIRCQEQQRKYDACDDVKIKMIQLSDGTNQCIVSRVYH